MGAKIEPRACRYCKFYGHTRQWCKVRIEKEKAMDEREAEELLAQDHALGITADRPADTEWARWCRLASVASHELCEIKDEWSSEEWEREFRKRAGHFDHVNQCINF